MSDPKPPVLLVEPAQADAAPSTSSSPAMVEPEPSAELADGEGFEGLDDLAGSALDWLSANFDELSDAPTVASKPTLPVLAPVAVSPVRAVQEAPVEFDSFELESAWDMGDLDLNEAFTLDEEVVLDEGFEVDEVLLDEAPEMAVETAPLEASAADFMRLEEPPPEQSPRTLKVPRIEAFALELQSDSRVIEPLPALEVRPTPRIIEPLPAVEVRPTPRIIEVLPAVAGLEDAAVLGLEASARDEEVILNEEDLLQEDEEDVEEVVETRPAGSDFDQPPPAPTSKPARLDIKFDSDSDLSGERVSVRRSRAGVVLSPNLDARVHPADQGLPPSIPLSPPGVGRGAPWTLWGTARAVRREGARQYFAKRWRSVVKTTLVAAFIFTLAFVTYATFSWNRFGQPSEDTHFVYLAHTLNQCLAKRAPFEEKCTFEMLVPPPHGNDWASWIELPVKGDETLKGIWLDRGQGKFRTLDGNLYIIKSEDLDHGRRQVTHTFVSFPPGPALLMMPLIPDVDSPEVDLKDPKKLGLNDVKFTIVFAALNVLLMFFLLQHLTQLGASTRTTRENAVLTVLFALGTNVLWCSILGQVWFTALVVGLTFTLLYILAAIDTRHPLLAGIFLAFAMATRTPLAFSFVFFAYFLFFPDGRIRRKNWGEFLYKSVLFAVPILAVGAFLMWMNSARFENPGEFGHTYLAQGGLRRIQLYGLFNYHFLSKNLIAAFALLPRIQPHAPYVIFSKHGMSLFLTTPPLLYLLAYRTGSRQLDRKWFWALVATTAAIAIPGLFYQNTGWSQFGFRFSVDYTPYLVLLLALNRRRIGVFFVALMLVGILVNSAGAISFGRMPEYYQDWIIDPDR